MKPAAAWREIVARSNREEFQVVNSRSKGVRGERLWRDVLKAHGWTDARRGQQFRGGADSPDVVGGPEATHVEVKVREQHQSPWVYLEQAKAEAAPGKLPYVAMKRNHKPWLVVMDADDFLNLMRAREDHAKAVESAWNATVSADINPDNFGDQGDPS